MNGWFTSLTFWVGTLWGFSLGALLVWRTLAKPLNALFSLLPAHPTQEKEAGE